MNQASLPPMETFSIRPRAPACMHHSLVGPSEYSAGNTLSTPDAQKGFSSK